jgi:hypothetical protein
MERERLFVRLNDDKQWAALSKRKALHSKTAVKRGDRAAKGGAGARAVRTKRLAHI